MNYRKHWWQFWLPDCKHENKYEEIFIEEDMPSGGPNSKGSFGMATGDWCWHILHCIDCANVIKCNGHWAGNDGPCKVKFYE